MDRAGLRDLSRDSDEVARYCDDWAEEYDATLDEWRHEAPRQVASRLRAALSADAVILDAGCGTGLSGSALAAAGFRTIDGMYVSQRSLDIAAQRDVYRSLARVDMQKAAVAVSRWCLWWSRLRDCTDARAGQRADPGEFCRIVRPGRAMVLTQRSDLLVERDFPSTLAQLEADGLLAGVRISDPMPYLPDNPEFGDEVKVHCIQCTVV